LSADLAEWRLGFVDFVRSDIDRNPNFIGEHSVGSCFDADFI
jgi:hypothetical protein